MTLVLFFNTDKSRPGFINFSVEIKNMDSKCSYKKHVSKERVNTGCEL